MLQIRNFAEELNAACIDLESLDSVAEIEAALQSESPWCVNLQAILTEVGADNCAFKL